MKKITISYLDNNGVERTSVFDESVLGPESVEAIVVAMIYALNKINSVTESNEEEARQVDPCPRRKAMEEIQLERLRKQRDSGRQIAPPEALKVTRQPTPAVMLGRDPHYDSKEIMLDSNPQSE